VIACAVGRATVLSTRAAQAASSHTTPNAASAPFSEDAEVVLDLLLLLLILQDLAIHLLALLLEVLNTCRTEDLQRRETGQGREEQGTVATDDSGAQGEVGETHI
jgi:hypothetical protein